MMAMVNVALWATILKRVGHGCMCKKGGKVQSTKTTQATNSAQTTQTKLREFKKSLSIAASVYSWGSRGQTVRDIQLRLRDLGYFNSSIDGIFGQKTYDAVVQFQKDNGLTPDGVVGQATLGLLGLDEIFASDNDLYTLASAIYGEGRGEPYTGQVAIGAVILNRVKNSDFPNTIPGVVYQRGAFDAVSDGQINLTPDETAINAAKDALAGWDPTNGALYYWNPATATSKWIWSVPITSSIGRDVFGKK